MRAIRMEAPMIEGSCMCGGVKYEATGPLTLMARCHCVQCRKASGAEFATNGNVPADGFHLVSGEDLLRRYESSPGKFRVFCGRCGSPLWKRDDTKPDVLRLRLGCV
ncbi:MAG: GFA family protein, partial [Polyangiales bacterium]